MKYIAFSILISIVLLGCNESKKVSKTKAESKVSAQTEIFIQQLNAEIANSNDNFQPSEILVKNYRLQKMESSFYIGGIISIEEDLNEEQILQMGVTIGTKAGNIWTVMIPILKIEELLLLPGINYVQIDEDVNLKKTNY